MNLGQHRYNLIIQHLSDSISATVTGLDFIVRRFHDLYTHTDLDIYDRTILYNHASCLWYFSKHKVSIT